MTTSFKEGFGVYINQFMSTSLYQEKDTLLLNSFSSDKITCVQYKTGVEGVWPGYMQPRRGDGDGDGTNLHGDGDGKRKIRCGKIRSECEQRQRKKEKRYGVLHVPWKMPVNPRLR
jgi:hypothetical protein